MSSAAERKRIGLHVEQAARSVRALDPSALAASIQFLLDDDRWREFLSPLDLQLHTHESFATFVEQELGTTGDGLVKALRNYPRLGAEVADRLIAPMGRLKATSSANRGRYLRSSRTSGMEMRRLIKARPDLASRVDAGELSIAAAMIEAGMGTRKAAAPADLTGFALYGIRKFGREALLQAVQDAEEETRECLYCKRPFTSRNRRQVTCGEAPCKRARERDTLRRSRARRKAEREARDGR